jgi:uncharacterized repeat protein (TIGR01451 family)
MKKLITILLILSCAYAAHTGIFYSGKTKLTLGSNTIEESRIGSLLGVASGGLYRLETIFGFYSESPNIKITQRNYAIEYPENYAGISANAEIVPGAKLHFVINLKNITSITANNCLIEDLVPEHTHFYNATTPSLVGDCINISYAGVTTNAGPGEAISFRFDFLPQGNATFNYTVTVD